MKVFPGRQCCWPVGGKVFAAMQSYGGMGVQVCRGMALRRGGWSGMAHFHGFCGVSNKLLGDCGGSWGKALVNFHGCVMLVGILVAMYDSWNLI